MLEALVAYVVSHVARVERLVVRRRLARTRDDLQHTAVAEAHKKN